MQVIRETVMVGTATGGQQRLGELGRGLRLPMIAAPMFLVSGPDLVLACCRAGIVGSFPAPNARTAEALDDWMGRIAAGHAALAAERPPHLGPWALNLVTHSSYERLPAELDLVSRHRPPLVITALGSPVPAIERVHAYGGKVFADVSTLSFARKAVAAGVDGLMLVSAGAGGHTGKISPFAFIAAVRTFFDGVIVLSGAIGSGAAVRAAEVAGADLSNAGTPFIVASESLATPNYKDMVTRASLEDLVLTKVFTGAEAYYLRESIAAAGLDPDNLQGKSKMDLSGTQDQVKAWKDIWSAGQGVDDVRRIESVEQIVSRYERGYREACILPAFGAGAQA
jgi:nitronate monooxygenase